MPLDRPSIAAVSYLNTVPLIWGFEHSHLRDRVDLQLCVPSECARRLAAGKAGLGLVPVAEMARQKLKAIPGLGIACRGAVRSILLLCPSGPERIGRLAADSGSRTSVVLARAILRRRYGVDPEIVEMDPEPRAMLEAADAALLIGDAALRVDPAHSRTLDLGAEWMALTGLPMVFAQWAGAPERIDRLMASGAAGVFEESLGHGLAHMEEIVAAESAGRGFAPALVRSYLTRHIVFRIGPEEERGLRVFLGYMAEDEAAANQDAAGVPLGV